jgi:hypothetical protein
MLRTVCSAAPAAPNVTKDLPAAPRLGVALIIVAFVVLDSALPDRYRLVPPGFLYFVAGLMIVPMAIAAIVKGRGPWRRIERTLTFAAVGCALLINTANLIDVVGEMLFRARDVRPMPLFLTSIAIWIGNMLIFALVYWLTDRGGPDARAAGSTAYPDFDFPAMSDPSKVPPGWQPGTIDYLFLAFTTTTAFSPTEAMPLTQRAKALVIVQSSISLITIVVVAARAIGLLQ